MSNLKLFQTALRAEMLQVHSQHGKGNRCQISSKYLEKCGGYSHLNLKIGWKNEYFFLPLHIFGDSVKTVTDRDLGLILLDSSPPCASFWLFVSFHILYLTDYSSWLFAGVSLPLCWSPIASMLESHWLFARVPLTLCSSPLASHLLPSLPSPVACFLPYFSNLFLWCDLFNYFYMIEEFSVLTIYKSIA